MRGEDEDMSIKLFFPYRLIFETSTLLAEDPFNYQFLLVTSARKLLKSEVSKTSLEERA